MSLEGLRGRLRSVFTRKPKDEETAAHADAAVVEDAQEARPLGDSLPDLRAETPPAERLTAALSDALAAVDKAAEMLQSQAKRQQQFTDELAALPETLRRQTQEQMAESVRHEARAEEADLAKRLDELAGQLPAILEQDRRLTEGQDRLAARLDAFEAALGRELSRQLSEQLSGQLNGLAERMERHAKASARQASSLRWIILGVAILAAAASAAAMAAWLR